MNKPTSAMAEAVRNLRTGILLSSVDRSPRVIVITSALPGEGKTTTTLALAQNLTAMGRKVLVIEGDVRICSLGLYFDDLPADYPGVAAVINGDHGLAEAVVPIAGYGDLLFGRKVAVNAADLFSSQRFAALIEEARASYDIVLIDTPPVLVVPDARVIAQQADTVVFSVHWDSTSRTQIQEALHQLEMVNIRIAGISLNRVDPKGMRKYGYGGKHAGYGGYASYGSKYYGN
ncbi:MAG: CpsD/CapB family tyrosine-protein kinase [Rhodobacter sp.]|nr:CpsD/CapB family tyrosine-protein kinase [Rhodobacter sp.]